MPPRFYTLPMLCPNRAVTIEENMAPNIQPGVEALLENPDERAGVSLILGVEDAESEELIAQIESTGAEVDESLFYDNLAVSISDETDLATLCSIEGVDSVEIEGVWEPLEDGDQENFRTPSSAHPKNSVKR